MRNKHTVKNEVFLNVQNKPEMKMKARWLWRKCWFVVCTDNQICLVITFYIYVASEVKSKECSVAVCQVKWF